MIRLSKLEEDILNVLWELDRAFPKVLIEHLTQPVPPYNTVLSTVRKMEKKGYVGYQKYGKTHEYYPILQKEQYTSSLLKKAYRDLMGASKEGMLSYFVKEEKIDIDELEEMVRKLKSERND